LRNTVLETKYLKTKKNFVLGVEDLEKSDNPALRRVAARRGTMRAFEERRDTFIGAERRRSTIRRMSSVQSNGLTTEVKASSINDVTFDLL
jgi:hypothetical protein